MSPTVFVRLVIAGGAAAILAGAALLAASSTRPDSNQQASTSSMLDDPLARFGKLMPVFMHPRCANCHGLVNPFTGDNDNPFRGHDGDRVRVSPVSPGGPLLSAEGDHIPGRNETCLGCHNDPGAKLWRLAPRRMDFRGRTALTLCRQLQNEQRTSQAFLNHLKTDPLQSVAFRGRRGIVDPPLDPIFPPMGSTVFFNLAQEWLKGHQNIPCSGWVGTITQTETVDLTTTYRPPQGEGVTVESQVATRTTTISFGEAAGATVEITVVGAHRSETTWTITDRGASCTSFGRSDETYGGKTSGDLTEATLTIGASDGRYSIDITGPAERTTTVERTLSRLCMVPEAKDSQDDTHSHTGWQFRIEGVAPVGRLGLLLEGKDTKVVTENDDRSWFLSRNAHVYPLQTRDDGNLLPVPVTVTTTWNLRRDPESPVK